MTDRDVTVHRRKFHWSSLIF